MSWKPKRWLRQVLAGWIPYCRPSNSVTAQKGSWYTDANQTKSHTGSHPSLIHKLPMKITNGNNARSSTWVHQCQYTNYKPDNIVQCSITHTTTVTASSSASTAIFQLVNLSWLVPPQLLPPTDPEENIGDSCTRFFMERMPLLSVPSSAFVHPDIHSHWVNTNVYHAELDLSCSVCWT